jgi:hypothetical protein
MGRLRSLQRRVPLGVQILAVVAAGMFLLLGVAAFGDLPGPSPFYEENELVPCSAKSAEVEAPAEPPPGPGKWRREPSLPASLDEVQATAVGDRIFVGTGADLGDNRIVSVDRLFEFDPRRGRYAEPTSTPDPLDHSRFVGHDGDLYVVGGYSLGKVTNALRRYSPEDERWTELDGMHRARAAHGAAVIGDRLYVAGGATEYGPDLPAPMASLEVYDLNTGEWSEGPDMPTPRHHFGLVALDGKLYAVGGRDADDFAIDTVERFDPATGRWETLPPLPQAAGGLAVAATDGEVYAIGGGDDGLGWVTGATWAFDPEVGQWRRAADLEFPRHGLGVATIDGRIYTFGGAPCALFGYSDSAESLAAR